MRNDMKPITPDVALADCCAEIIRILDNGTLFDYKTFNAELALYRAACLYQEAMGKNED